MAISAAGKKKKAAAAAAAKKKADAAGKEKARNLATKPKDYIRGGIKTGQKYTAYDTYGQGRPDFGKDKGPGDPYHEVTKTIPKKLPKPPQRKLPKLPPVDKVTPKPGMPAWRPSRPGGVIKRPTPYGQTTTDDPRVAAIRRRLGNVK